MFEAFGLFVGALGLRLLAASNSRTAFDTYGHLYLAKEVKLQSAGPFGRIVTRVVGSTGFSQPFLWHWLIGFFPIATVVRSQRWINPIIDAVFAVAVYLSGRLANLGTEASVLMTLLYVLTPMWFSSLSAGPRVSSLTPRLTSEVLTNAFFIVTLLPLGIPVPLSMAAGAALVAIVVLSSKFGFQAMLFLTPLAAVFVADSLPLIAMMLGLVLAATVTKGQFFTMARAQIGHLGWYFRKNLRGETAAAHRNELKRLFGAAENGADPWRHAAVVLYRMTTRNSFTAVVIKMPVLIVGVVLLLRAHLNAAEPTDWRIAGPVIGAIVVFLAINTRWFLFLGEAERYLNHVAFFIVAMAATMAIDQSLGWLLWMIIGYGFLFWVLEVVFWTHRVPQWYRLKQAADDRIIAHLNSLERSAVVLAYPYLAAGGVFRIMLETQHQVVFCFTTPPQFAAEFEAKYGADYPYVQLDKLEEMAAELGVSYVIVYKKALAARGLGSWTPHGQWRRLDVGDPSYDVYQREPES